MHLAKGGEARALFGSSSAASRNSANASSSLSCARYTAPRSRRASRAGGATRARSAVGRGRQIQIASCCAAGGRLLTSRPATRRQRRDAASKAGGQPSRRGSRLTGPSRHWAGPEDGNAATVCSSTSRAAPESGAAPRARRPGRSARVRCRGSGAWRPGGARRRGPAPRVSDATPSSRRISEASRPGTRKDQRRHGLRPILTPQRPTPAPPGPIAARLADQRVGLGGGAQAGQRFGLLRLAKQRDAAGVRSSGEQRGFVPKRRPGDRAAAGRAGAAGGGCGAALATPSRLAVSRRGVVGPAPRGGRSIAAVTSPGSAPSPAKGRGRSRAPVLSPHDSPRRTWIGAIVRHRRGVEVRQRVPHPSAFEIRRAQRRAHLGRLCGGGRDGAGESRFPTRATASSHRASRRSSRRARP